MCVHMQVCAMHVLKHVWKSEQLVGNIPTSTMAVLKGAVCHEAWYYVHPRSRLFCPPTISKGECNAVINNVA